MTTHPSASLAVRSIAALAPSPDLAAPAAPRADYTLAVPADARVALARGWLYLGLAALVGSGLFSVLLVAARTPGVNRWLPGNDFFRVALVTHVDFSVLVWFISLAGVLWSLNSPARVLREGWAALTLSGIGAAAMALAPFVDAGTPIMANYIPVLTGPLFLGGLLVFGAGVALLTLRALARAPRLGRTLDGDAALRFGLTVAAVATAVALLSFGWSWWVTPAPAVPNALTYYEILFWGGGHSLQFTWTLLMLVAWLWLAGACGARVPLSPRVTLLMFVLALAAVFVTPYAYLAYDVTSVEHRGLLTWAMRLGGGVATVPVALAALAGLRRADALGPRARPLCAALLSSVLLFGVGGLIGVFIAGNNVRIPAHYHGSIVGVTLALMGVVYQLLPALGYTAPAGRLAHAQPWVYGVGQLMHIAGLVWSGGYGVQRKVAGAGQPLRSLEQMAGMGLMGLGGLIAVLGGVLFAVIVIRALTRGRPAWRITATGHA
jgi:hypothetical protein